jgi:hypothetical protein
MATIARLIGQYGAGNDHLEVGSHHLHPVIGADEPSPADMQRSALMYSEARKFDGRWARSGWLELIVTPSKARGLERPDIAAWFTQPHRSISDWFVCERAPLEVRS